VPQTDPEMDLTIKGEEEDVKGNKVIKLENFDKQNITLGTSVQLNDKGRLCLNVFPGSGMSLKITVGNDTVEKEYSYDLKPHTWNALDIDLAGLLIKTEGKINRINLSCAPGGRTLYLDHIYFCEESEGEGEEPSEPEGPVGPTVAAPTPLQAESRVVSETPAIKMASIEQRWNSLDILLFDYQKYINMANLYSIRLESNKPTIF